MVLILVLKFFLLRKNIHNFLQPLDLKSSFSGQLKIFSELIRWDDLKHSSLVSRGKSLNLAYYLIDDGGMKIVVLRVAYNRRNQDKKLKSD